VFDSRQILKQQEHRGDRAAEEVRQGGRLLFSCCWGVARMFFAMLPMQGEEIEVLKKCERWEAVILFSNVAAAGV
jgi:hypothetical protein